jgi:deoxyribodipyrimidine photo-lyase
LTKTPINILWYKRDLRVYDHEPLQKAIETGLPTMVFYAFEPSVLAYPDWDLRHGRFVFQSILDLQRRHPQLELRVFFGEILPIFEEILADFDVKNLFSHEEIGTKITFDRDKSVASFCKKNHISWSESPTNAVIRGSKNRLGWDKSWNQRMFSPIIYPDLKKLKTVDFSEKWGKLAIPDALLASFQIENPLFQTGGESKGIAILADFLKNRYQNYQKGISKPELAQTTCSRLSPYLAWGNLSIRQVIQAVEKTKKNTPIRERPMGAFVSRLHWHCHFIQKFESECRTEFENVNRGYDLLAKSNNLQHLEAWKLGMTGFPLVDACMRSVAATGYLNFRMRAMVVSFLTHNIWQYWQSGVYHLAKQFLDYEPGIHFPQFQMQAGVTGINTIRIYSPVRNSLLHDSEAVFIKKWVPEIAHLPLIFIHEPQKMTPLEQEFYQVRLGQEYPAPIINLDETRKTNTEKMWSHRKHPAVIAENNRILFRHTFRKSAKDQPIINFQAQNFVIETDEDEDEQAD